MTLRIFQGSLNVQNQMQKLPALFASATSRQFKGTARVFLQFLFLKLWDFPASQIRNLPFALMINPLQQSLETHSQFANLHRSIPSFSFNSMCLSQVITKYNNKSKPITGTMRRVFLLKHQFGHIHVFFNGYLIIFVMFIIIFTTNPN